MAILKVITPTDIGDGLAIVANKLVPNVDGTRVIVNGSGQITIPIDPAVVNALVSLSGLASGSADLGTFTGALIPDSQTVKQAIQALETAIESENVTGQYAGSAATLAALPATTDDGKPVNNGDWAILTADDGTNESGIYVFDGTDYQLAKIIPEVFALVVETTDTDTIAFTGDGNTGTELSGSVKIDGTLVGNLLKVIAGQGLGVDPADIKTALTFDNELQSLSGDTLGYFNSTTNFA